jgi:hypothetical protein
MDITPDLRPNCLLGRQTTSSSQPSPVRTAPLPFRRAYRGGPRPRFVRRKITLNNQSRRAWISCARRGGARARVEEEFRH